jgi:hypothetical protein
MHNIDFQATNKLSCFLMPSFIFFRSKFNHYGSSTKKPNVTTSTAPTISPVDDVIVLVIEESYELQKVEAGRILTWFKARDYDIERHYLPTKEDLKLYNVQADRGISMDEWQPVRRLDGVEVDYVQIRTWVNGDSAYMSHY